MRAAGASVKATFDQLGPRLRAVVRAGLDARFGDGVSAVSDLVIQRTADGDGLVDGDVGGLRHGVGGFDASGEAPGFDHADGFAHCWDALGLGEGST